MHRAMDRNQPRIFLLESGDALCTAMRGAIVHDPENLAGLIVRRLPHDLVNQPLERGDTASALTTAKHLGAMPIEGSQVGPGAAAMVFMLDAHGRPRLGGQAGWAGWVFTNPRLDARFLVGGEHELIVAEGLTLPDPLIEDPGSVPP